MLNNVVVPALAAVALAVVWPVAVYLKGKEVLPKKGSTGLEQEREFAVEPGHLREALTVPQIEAREKVSDPMGAVPDLPFGHLNAAWKAFIEGVQANDQLWSFAATWQTTWECKELRTGYATVRGGIPAAHFLTMRKDVEDEPLDGQVLDAVSDGEEKARK